MDGNGEKIRKTELVKDRESLSLFLTFLDPPLILITNTIP